MIDGKDCLMTPTPFPFSCHLLLFRMLSARYRHTYFGSSIVAFYLYWILIVILDLIFFSASKFCFLYILNHLSSWVCWPLYCFCLYGLTSIYIDSCLHLLLLILTFVYVYVDSFLCWHLFILTLVHIDSCLF